MIIVSTGEYELCPAESHVVCVVICESLPLFIYTAMSLDCNTNISKFRESIFLLCICS